MLEYAAQKRMAIDTSLQEREQAERARQQARRIKNSQQRKNAQNKANKRLEEAERACFRESPMIAFLELKAQNSKLRTSFTELWSPPAPKYVAMLDALALHQEYPDVTRFPSGSWCIQFQFTLRKPYISRDDDPFTLLDNPLKKDWVFKVPYVAPSQWKGALRSAMILELGARFQNNELSVDALTEERLRLVRMFGHEKGDSDLDGGAAYYFNQLTARSQMPPLAENATEKAIKTWKSDLKRRIKEAGESFAQILAAQGYRKGDVEGFQGRLRFYPTFFDSVGLEVINPHIRKTGAGDLPIYFECVPQDTKGWFTALYVPLDAVDKAERLKQAQADLQSLLAGLEAMFLRYGFGAKTSSGYGVARTTLENVKLSLHDRKGRQVLEAPQVELKGLATSTQ